MSVIGLPGFDLLRRAVRMDINPMDKSTIVSVYPRDIQEKKLTIEPGVFNILAGSEERPSVTVIGSSSWWKDVGDDQPLIEVPVSSVTVARSIVNDFCNGLLGVNMGDTMPGIFFVPGEHTVASISTNYSTALNEAIVKQKKWFATLVKLADTLWSRSNGNPLAISDDMRLAAKYLGLDTKPWLQDFQAMSTVNCVACGAMRNPAFPVCPNCRTVIDVDRAKELGLELVQR